MIDNDIEERGEMFGDQDDDVEFGFNNNADEDPTAQIDSMLSQSKNSDWGIEWARMILHDRSFAVRV